jgi:sugar lactone lactonase YvrE
MSKTGEQGTGAIYHVAKGIVTQIFGGLSIPNSMCFSTDGKLGYYVDTKINRLMRVSLDPQTGLPNGEARVLVDQNGQPGGIDGSICDSEGTIWNARWGQGAVDRYDADGTHIGRYLLPAKQTSCPAFMGNGRIAVTSAWEGLDDSGRSEDPLAGALFEILVPIRSQGDPAYIL